MEFHHRDPKSKEFTIGNKVGHLIFDKLKVELDKCDLLCCHCHRTLHAGDHLSEYTQRMDETLKTLEILRKNDGVIKKIGLSKNYSKEMMTSLIDNGKTIKDISKILKEPYRAVQALLAKYNLETKEGKRPRISKESSIIRDYTTFHYSMDRVCSKYSLDPESVTKILIEKDIPIRKSMKNIRLDIDRIKQLLDSGISKSKISKIVGCGDYSIYRICKKMGW